MRKVLFLVVLAFTLPIALCYGQSSAYYNFRNPMHALAAYNACLYVDTPAGVFYTVGPTWDSVNIISPGLAYPAFGIRFNKWRISDGQLLQAGTSQQGLVDTTAGNTRTYAINLGSNPGLHRLSNGSFLTAITTADTGNYYRVGLLCMDSMGSKLWLKEFQKPTCVVPRADFDPRVMRRTASGEWIILARNTCNDRTSGLSYGDIVVMKLDSNFNLLWTKLFPMPPDYNFTPGALLVEGDGYAMGISITKPTGNQTQPSLDYNLIYKLDTLGILQWVWTSDITEHEAALKEIIRTPDSGYLYCGMGHGIIQNYGQPNAQYQFYTIVRKLSKARQVEWLYSDTAAFFPARRVLPLPDGGFLFSSQYPGGTVANNTGAYYGALYRIDSGGNLRWRRKYTPDTAISTDGEIFDMAFCGGGDVVFTGVTTNNFSVPSNAQQAWIVKVDSNGCVGPNDPQCSPTAVERVALPTTGVQVHPNPTTGVVRVTIGTLAEMSVTDLTGRVVFAASLKEGTQELSLSSLPAGLYLYRIQTSAGSIFTGKLVKQ